MTPAPAAAQRGDRDPPAFGLEAAQLALGHSSAQVTDAVYAERNMNNVTKIMQQVG